MAIVLVLILVFGHASASAFVDEKTFQRMVNRTRLMPTTGYIQQTNRTRSKADCGTDCTMTSNCTTFYYDSEVSTCQLHASLPAPGTSMTYAPKAECYSTEEEPNLWSSPITSSTTTQTTTVSTAPQCIYGTFSFNNGEKCYFFDNGLQRPFDDSKNFCTNNGGIIVKIDNVDQHNFIADMLTNNGFAGSYYIGLHDLNGDDVYRWSDPANSFILYANWGGSQPANGAEDCVVMYQPDNYRWHNTDCTTTSAYVVCET